MCEHLEFALCESYSFSLYILFQIKRDGITKLVVLPLYPQFSISTSGSSLRLLERIFRWGSHIFHILVYQDHICFNHLPFCA